MGGTKIIKLYISSFKLAVRLKETGQTQLMCEAEPSEISLKPVFDYDMQCYMYAQQSDYSAMCSMKYNFTFNDYCGNTMANYTYMVQG